MLFALIAASGGRHAMTIEITTSHLKWSLYATGATLGAGLQLALLRSHVGDLRNAPQERLVLR
jgi:hypothetical protein